MKFSTIYKQILKEEQPPVAPQKQQVVKKEVPQPEPKQEVDPLRSNIDQFWMNPEDMKSDLTKWLSKIQSEDPELARYLINGMREVLGHFRYKPEANKEEQPQQ